MKDEKKHKQFTSFLVQPLRWEYSEQIKADLINTQQMNEQQTNLEHVQFAYYLAGCHKYLNMR